MNKIATRIFAMILVVVMMSSSFFGVLATTTIDKQQSKKPEATTEVADTPDKESSTANPEVNEPPALESAKPEDTEQPEAPEEFVPLSISEQSQDIEAKLQDKIALNVKLNREDVLVEYQWQKGIISENPELVDWKILESEVKSELSLTVVEESFNEAFRCIVTINDEEYLKEATAEAIRLITENGIVGEDGTITHPENPADFVELNKGLSSAPIVITRAKPKQAARTAGSVPSVSIDGGWISGVDRTMEYITADGYDRLNASAADDLNWTRLSGGNRPDGTPYLSGYVVPATHKLPISSAWYGKTVYFRYVGMSGKGSAVEIPSHTGQAGADGVLPKTNLYKEIISTLVVRIPETRLDFYSSYINQISDKSTMLLLNAPNCAIAQTQVPLTPDGITYLGKDFNSNAESYLKDAEGNYRYDSVLVGVAVLSEPDLSGAAAWALKDYINEGYGFMTGHDMIYGYGGVNSKDYEPDRASTETPYYWLNTNINGHWNMNWLMGVNEQYKDVSPYNAASKILALGDWHDKSTLYGDADVANYNSTLRVSTFNSTLDPINNVFHRTPTNYPYSTIDNPQTGASEPIGQGTLFAGLGTHSNQQIAYGTVWVDFASNSLDTSGLGRLVTDKRATGEYGTNNFYLTTNGNFAMNQIGHVVTGKVPKYPELQIFANSVMYISQRVQCQVCQSEQGGNKEIHFVKRITSVAELEKIRNQTENWYTYPSNSCYMLANNITLPDNWIPIEGFRGHFSADNYGAQNGSLTNHRVTLGANGAPLFSNTSGNINDFSSAGEGWNLGTDMSIGTDTLFNAQGSRTTGIARVSGFLSNLIGGAPADWANKIVVIKGTDGKEYYCKTNLDGKYVFSNLPCSDTTMRAYVYNTSSYSSDMSAFGIRENGNIYVDVLPEFFNTCDTTQLYLKGNKPKPLRDDTVYEGDTASLISGGVYYPRPVTEIVWEFRKPGTNDWLPITSCDYEYEIQKTIFHDLGEKSWTEVGIKVENTKLSQSGTNFRAICTADSGVASNTFDVGETGFMGLLTVKPFPMSITDPTPQTVWLDNSATFSSTCDFQTDIKSDPNFKVEWQCKVVGSKEWENLSNSEIKYTVKNTVSKGTIDPILAPRKTTSVLKIVESETIWTEWEFRAVFTRLASNGVSNGAELTVKKPTLEVSSAVDQTLQINNGDMATGTAVYESVIKYSPKITDSNTPEFNVQWMFSGGKGSYDNFALKPFTQASANAQAALLGVPTDKYPKITVKTEDIATTDPDFREVKTTLTISNVHSLFDRDSTRYFFVPTASIQFKNEQMTVAADERAALILEYSCDIKYNDASRELGLKDSGNAVYGKWTYPKMTVSAGQPIYTCILRFDGNYDAKDFLTLSGTPPQDMVKAVSSPTYMMLTSASGVSAEELQEYLRESLSYTSYDPQIKPAKLFAYIDCANNIAPRAAQSIRMTNLISTPKEIVTVTKNPTSVVIKPSANAVFSAVGSSNTGTDVQYQWQSSSNKGITWADIDGEVSPTLTIIKTMNIQNGWYYRCKMSTPDSVPAFSTAASITISSNDIVVPLNPNYRWVTAVNGTAASTVNNTNLQLYINGYANSQNYSRVYLQHADGRYVSPSEFSQITFSYSCTGFSSNLGGLGEGNADLCYNSNWGDRIFDWGGTRTLSSSAFNTGYVYFEVRVHAYAGWCDLTYQINNVTLIGATGGNIKPEDADLSRTDKSAMDTTQIYRELSPAAAKVTVDINAEDKIYDGIEQNAKVTLDSDIVLSQATLDGIFSRAKVVYSNGTETEANAQNSGCIEVKRYTAKIEFALEDVIAYGLSGKTTCSFTISKRPVNLKSIDNNKVYDGNYSAQIENIEAESVNHAEKRGIITSDIGKVELSKISVFGEYRDRNQTNGHQQGITRIEAMDLVGEKAHNYYIDEEIYTGAIDPRPLTVHSLYLEEPQNPRNIKQYDSTTQAVISDILIDNIINRDNVWVDAQSYTGYYEKETAGELLNPDGTVQKDRLLNLMEYKITRAAPISLINNGYGNYFIYSEKYSGAITRRAIEARVSDSTSVYGSAAHLELVEMEEYSFTEAGQGSGLTISALVGDDKLIIDKNKSDFVLPEEAENATTPVGSYIIGYDGLNETNYPVLENYIMVKIPGQLIVTPKKLIVKVDGGYTKYEKAQNPPFTATISGFVIGDNEQNSLTGERRYSSLCGLLTPVKYGENGKPQPYEIVVYGLSAVENINGLANYEIEYVSGDITVFPMPPELPPMGDTSETSSAIWLGVAWSLMVLAFSTVATLSFKKIISNRREEEDKETRDNNEEK